MTPFETPRPSQHEIEVSYHQLFDLALQDVPEELAARWEQEIDARTDLTTAQQRYEALQQKIDRRAGRGSERPRVEMNPKFMATPEDVARMDRLSREVSHTINNPDYFIGNGSSANVFFIEGSHGACVKVIHNHAEYQTGNSIRQEADYMMEVEKLEVAGVCAPAFYFYAPTSHHIAFCMERIDGADISRLLSGQSRVRAVESVDPHKFGAALDAYVAALHERNLVHGDLAPRNIMITHDTLLPRVIDFGKTKHRHELTRDQWNDTVARERMTAAQTTRYLQDYLDGKRIDFSKQV